RRCEDRIGARIVTIQENIRSKEYAVPQGAVGITAKSERRQCQGCNSGDLLCCFHVSVFVLRSGRTVQVREAMNQPITRQIIHSWDSCQMRANSRSSKTGEAGKQTR